MRNLTKRRLITPSDGYLIAQKIRPIFGNFKLLVAILLMSISSAFAQSLTVEPNKPTAGALLNFSYDSKGGKFENDTLKVATVIFSDGFNQIGKKIALVKDGKIYRGQFQTDSTMLLVAFAFSLKDKWDLAPKEGHLYPFYSNDKIVEGALPVMADFFINKTGKLIYGFDPNYQKAAELLKQEMELYPNSKAMSVTMQKYYQAIYNLDPIKGKAEALAKINAINQQPKKIDMDYLLQFRLYEAIGMSNEAGKTMDALSVAFPNSPIIFAKRLKDAETPRAASTMEMIGNKLITDYDMVNSNFKVYVHSVYRAINQAYVKELNLAKFYLYVQKHNDATWQVADLLSAGQYLVNQHQKLSNALDICKQGMVMIDTMLSKTSDPIQQQKLKERKAEFKGVLGQIYYQQARYQDALVSLKDARLEGKGNPEAIDLYYALTLVKQKDYLQAQPLLYNAILNGKSTPEILQAYKESYLNNPESKNDYEVHIHNLLAEAASKKSIALNKLAIKKPAPNFTLLDHSGKKVSLSDFKGKIVVLDFWATWCMPCLAAFPGMQKLVNKYKNDKDVVFLFVNTAETSSNDLKKRINSYLNKENYTFRVLIDEKNPENSGKYKVQEQYNAHSIPLKVVIDKEGNIRFKSTGYLGSDDKVVEELSEFIEAAKL